MDSLDAVKVLFLLNTDVLYVLAENFACTPSSESMSHTKVFAAVPATATGSGFSYSIGTGEGAEIAPALEPGKYRMHCPVAKTDNYLVVRRKSQESERPVTLPVKVSDLVWKHPFGKERAVLTVPHGRIQFDVFPDTKSFFVLRIQNDEDEKKLLFLPQDERDLYTPASRVMHHPIFNALFQEQQVVAVPRDIFFSISNVVLVFTDIVDSTRLYTNLGDGAAFRLVRKHFQVLFSTFIKRGGRVVKTIGDALMASFTTGRAAMQGVADAMELLPTIGRRPDNQKYIEIRVGVHCGLATVVPLNGVNDFFGQTTNIAARIQSVAKASECFVSQAVLDSSPDSLECYTEIIGPCSRFTSTPVTELSLKGLDQKVQARGFRFSKKTQKRSSDSSLNTSFSNRLEHTRISYREVEGDDDNEVHTSMKLFDRPAETARRNSNMDPTFEQHDEE
jgi:class 3 adenylate cyclase